MCESVTMATDAFSGISLQTAALFIKTERNETWKIRGFMASSGSRGESFFIETPNKATG